MNARKEEVHVLRSSVFLVAGITFTWFCAPFMVSIVQFTHIHTLSLSLKVALATFATYVLVNRHNPDERLTAEKAFVALSLFNILRFPFAMFPMLISSIVQVYKVIISCHHC